MKKTYFRIRDIKSGQIVKTLIFKGDVSIIVTSMNLITVIEHESDQKTTPIKLTEDQAFSVANWGNVA